LADRFETKHANISISLTGGGSSSAVKAMLANANVIGQMSRPMKEKERESYKTQYGYEPLEIKIATDAIAIYVHKDNPLEQLSTSQLAGIFGSDKKKDGKSVDNWVDLNISSLNIEPWKTTEIEVFGLPSTTGAYSLFRKRILNKGAFNSRMKSFPTSSSVVQGTGVDKTAISFSSSFYATKRTHFVALEATDGNYYMPDDKSVINHQYPLSRYLYLYINPKPGLEQTPELKSFIHFLMEEDTQLLIQRAGFYPVTKAIRDKQADLFN